MSKVGRYFTQAIFSNDCNLPISQHVMNHPYGVASLQPKPNKTNCGIDLIYHPVIILNFSLTDL